MTGTPTHIFEFDSFRVEVKERRLWRDGEQVVLTPKAFDILVALVQSPGEIIDKQELMRSVWTDSFVEEGNLNHHVSTLRKILGDDRREQRFIKTIPKRGYQFTAGVREIVETDETLAIQNVSRSRVVIKEESTDGFWTTPKMALTSAIVLAAVIFGVWSVSTRGARTAGSSDNPEALASYKRGRELWRDRSASDLHEATLLLEHSVETDPGFARAHAALADAYAFDYSNWKKTEAEANKAIALDPAMGEPYASIGFVRMFWEWKFAEAEGEFKKAVSLSPDYATGHQWYAADLAAAGEIDPAIVEIREAIALEPASAAINTDLCQILYFARRNEEALSQCQKALTLDPGSPNANDLVPDIYAALGLHDEAVNKFVENERASRGGIAPPVIENIKRQYRDGGWEGFRRSQADYFTNIKPNYYKLARVYADLGERDKVLEALAVSFAEPDVQLVFLIADPAFASMQYDPQMYELQSKLLQGKAQ